MMKLRINPEVIEDIAEIKRYIREELCNPSAADRIAKKIVSAYKGLKTAPFIGTPLDSILEVKLIIVFSSAETISFFTK